MAQKTGIEWTDATWNPVTGCTKMSAGCDNCYAATLANRLLKDQYRAREPVQDTDIARQDPFAVRLWPERIAAPLEWKEPRTVFVNSMSDVFHADIPDDFVSSMFDVMLEAEWHTFQVLTKRPSRAHRFLTKHPEYLRDGRLPSNVWIGTSVENEDAAFRIRHLTSIPARVRFLSCEPLIGPLDPELAGIHWVIVGGESGPVRRPMKKEWVTRIRDRCAEADVPFFFKQWGGRTPKAGGREIGGRTWDEMPAVEAL